MDHAIYTAMGAASQTLNQQAVTASNLANASTPGFRAQLNALWKGFHCLRARW